MIATALPWTEILKTASLAVSLARDLLKHQSAKPREIVDPNSDVKSQLLVLTKKLEAIEAASTEQAKVVSMLAEQVQSLARRAAIGYWIGIAGLALAAVAVAALLVR